MEIGKKIRDLRVAKGITQEILADLHELEMEITKGLAELEGML